MKHRFVSQGNRMAVRLVLVLLAACMVLGMAACDSGGSDTSEKTSSSGGDTEGYSLPDVTLANKKIRFLVGIGTTLDDFRSPNPDYPGAVELFEKEYGGEIEIMNVDWNEYYTQLLSMYVADDMPDIAARMPESCPKDIINYLIQPLDSYTEYINLNDSIWDSTRDMIDIMTFNGKHYYAVRGTATAEILMYNPKLFNLAGLDTPYEVYKNDPDNYTWDRLIEWARELTVKETNGDIKQYGMVYGANGVITIQESTGKPLVEYTDDGIVNNIRSAEIADAANFFRDMGPAKYNVIPDIASHLAHKLFLNGTTAMIAESSWRITSTYKDMWKEGTIEIAPYPRYPKADKIYRGGVYEFTLLMNKAKNPQGGALFMTLQQYATSDAYKEKYPPQEGSTGYELADEIGIPHEQYDLYQDIETNRDKFPHVENIWLGWYDKGWDCGLKYVIDDPWSQVLELYAPEFDANIASQWEEFKSVISQ